MKDAYLWGGGGGYTRFWGVTTPFRRKWQNSTTMNHRGIKVHPGKFTFSESSLNLLSENVNFKSLGSVALIWSAIMFQSCRNAAVFTWNAPIPTSIGLYVSILVHIYHGLLNGVELELHTTFLYLSPLPRYHGLKSNTLTSTSKNVMVKSFIRNEEISSHFVLQKPFKSALWTSSSKH